MQAHPDGAGTGAHLSCKRREGNEEVDEDEDEEEEEHEEEDEQDEASG